MNVLAIIVAAGQGVRMGAGRSKAFVRLGGLTLLERSLAAFLSHPRVDRVVAAVPDPDEARRLLGPSAGRVVLVRGGATRQESVRSALQAATSAEDEIILVHDAARPLVPRAIIDAVIASAEKSGAAIPGLVPPDTIKQVDEEGAAVATLPRDRLRLAQTPPGFRGGVRRARARAARGDRGGPGRGGDPSPARPGRSLGRGRAVARGLRAAPRRARAARHGHALPRR